MNVRISRIDKTLPMPAYQTEGAVAFDLYSRTEETIEAKQTKLIPTNLIIEVPKGYALILAARSSTPKKGLNLANGIGVIDQDYHGPQDELKLFIYNFSDQSVTVPRGERIGQAMIIPIEQAQWEEVDQMKDASRGFWNHRLLVYN